MRKKIDDYRRFYNFPYYYDQLYVGRSEEQQLIRSYLEDDGLVFQLGVYKMQYLAQERYGLVTVIGDSGQREFMRLAVVEVAQ